MRIPEECARPSRWRGARVAVVAAFLVAGVLVAGSDAEVDFAELSLKDLMEIEVSSVARKQQSLSEAAAAVYIVSAEDIRRSGATSIPEALRMVPGLHVAQIDGSKWAITSRGFNNRFANKMLVLIDGRSVYTPLFAGVFWNAQDTLLEDVERIEVIRGPGATLWGANAVNGVINIMTKHARETWRGQFSGNLGDEERAHAGLRYGGPLGGRGHYRAYAKFFDRDEHRLASMQPADEWKSVRSGFRIDTDLDQRNALTVQGDIYDGQAGQTFAAPELDPPYVSIGRDETDYAGSNLMGRWTRTVSDDSDLALQVYLDRTEFSETRVAEKRETYDIDFQQRWSAAQRHELIWGVGFRSTRDRIEGTFAMSFTPDSRRDELFSAFVQDDISWLDGRLRLTLGSKFEHNDYTGFEVQPNLRALWRMRTGHSLWAAVSRPLRSPSRATANVRLTLQTFPDPGGGPVRAVTLFGNEDAVAESVVAHEVGYRACPSDRFCVDVTGFYNRYEHLITYEPRAPYLESAPSPAHVIVPLFVDNRMDGNSRGLELSSNVRLGRRFNVTGWYTFFDLDLTAHANSGDADAVGAERDAPRHQAHLRAWLDLPRGIQWDFAVYYVDALPNQGVPSYTRLDSRLAWKRDSFEAALVLQNLLDDRHVEFGSFLEVPTEVERGAYGRIAWRF